ncbi:hypothetical protein [Spirosoma pollinicola]|uniref:RNA polymerase sigma-70 region 2 domain-containing protein n=1 Tax=Spirosoma pollinicola TaxID=2057025 RepID=A0A2K8Z7P1_9BACT|nr:hypothetical protein [Spirosoma pollinicola]AUD05870.1 hypothetical protein CWM47_30905 [Spirosoma pollinicola]
MNVFTTPPPHPTKPPPQAFREFYATYAPRLWGFVLLAHLPATQSETILINTVRKAWQQLQSPIQSNTPCFSHILRVAYLEGLPINSSLATAIRQTRHP